MGYISTSLQLCWLQCLVLLDHKQLTLAVGFYAVVFIGNGEREMYSRGKGRTLEKNNLCSCILHLSRPEK